MVTKRQENALKTKQKLLDTAAGLIREGNFYDFNIEDITKACGCAKGTFYTYFKNKEELSDEVCRHLFNQIADRMQQMKNKSFVERLQHYFESFMVEVERYGINICREWIRNVIDPKTSSAGWDNSKWQFDVDMLNKILSEAIAAGELKNDVSVELLAHIIICELYGMMTCWCMSDGVFEPKDWTEKFFDMQVKPILNNYLTEGENKCNM